MEPKILLEKILEFTQENKFIFYKEVLRNNLSKLTSKVAVLTATGDTYSGKSLILNYCMKYFTDSSNFTCELKNPLDGFPFSQVAQNSNPSVNILVINNALRQTSEQETTASLVVLDINMRSEQGSFTGQEIQIYRALEMFCLTLGTCVLNLRSGNKEKEDKWLTYLSAPNYLKKTIYVHNNLSPLDKLQGNELKLNKYDETLNLNFLLEEKFDGFQGELCYVNDIDHLTSFLENVRSKLCSIPCEETTSFVNNCTKTVDNIQHNFETGKFRIQDPEPVVKVAVSDEDSVENLPLEPYSKLAGSDEDSVENLPPEPYSKLAGSDEDSVENLPTEPDSQVAESDEDSVENLPLKPVIQVVVSDEDSVEKPPKPFKRRVKPAPQPQISLDSFISHQIISNPACLVTRKKKLMFIQHLTQFAMENLPLAQESTINALIAENLQKLKPLLSLNDTFIFKLENELQRQTFVEPSRLTDLIQPNRKTMENKFSELQINDTNLKIFFTNLLDSSSQMMTSRNNLIFENEAKLDKQIIVKLINKLESKPFIRHIKGSQDLKDIIIRGIKEAKGVHSSVQLSGELLAKVEKEITEFVCKLGSNDVKRSPDEETDIETIDEFNSVNKFPGLGIYLGDFVQCSVFKENKFCGMSLNEFHFSLTDIPKVYSSITLSEPYSANVNAYNIELVSKAFCLGENRRSKVPVEVVFALGITHCLNQVNSKFPEECFQEIVIAVPYKLNSMHRKTIYDAAILSGIKSVRIISDIASAGLSLFPASRQILNGAKGENTHRFLLVQHKQNEIKTFKTEIRNDFIHILKKTAPKDCTATISRLKFWSVNNPAFESYEGSLHFGFFLNSNKKKKFTGKLNPVEGNPRLDIVNGAAYFAHCLSNGQIITLEDILPTEIQVASKSETKTLFEKGHKFPTEFTKSINSEDRSITISYDSKRNADCFEKYTIEPHHCKDLKATFSINNNGILSLELRSNHKNKALKYTKTSSHNLNLLEFQKCQEMFDSIISNNQN